MKKLIAIATILLIIMSCSDIEINDISTSVNTSSCVIDATIEQGCNTRSSINYFGEVSWTEDDYIGVFGEESQNVKFHFLQNQGNDNSFMGNFDTEKENMQFAYYPYQSDINVLNNSVTFEFSETQTYIPGNKAPMFGKVVSDKMINFYQMGGVLFLKLIGIPETVNTIQLSSDDSSPFLSGEIVIKDITSQYPTFQIEQGRHTLSYILSDVIDSKSMIYLYAPLQMGYYEKLYVTLLNRDNTIYKELSLTDMEVERGTLIDTKTINCSDLLYYQVLPDSIMKDSGWDYAMMTSADVLITWKLEEQTTLISTINLRNLDVVTITTDSIGNITNIFNDKEYLNIVQLDNGTISALLFNDSGIETLENITVERQNKGRDIITKAGVDELKIFSTIKDAFLFVNQLKDLNQAFNIKGLDDNFEYMVKLIGKPTGGLSNTLDLFSGVVSSKDSPFDMALEVGVYAEKKINESNVEFYNKLCGATISNIEPTIVNGQICFGYSLKNTSNIPSGKLGYDKVVRKCFTAVKKVPNGTRIPSISSVIATSPKYGEREIVNDVDELFYIPFEKGYTYYISSRIYLSAKYIETDLNSSYAGQEFMHTVTYTSDMSSISADNIGEIEVNEISYQNNQVVFDFNIWGDFVYDDFSRNWGIDLYHDNKKVSWESIFPLGLSGFRCILKLNRDDFDCDYSEFRATAKGRWQIGSHIVVDGTASNMYSQLVDFDELIYDTYPSLIFINPIIQKTEMIQTRSDDDDSDKYITFFSYGISLQGGFWIKQYTAKSDTEGPIAILSSTQPPYSDGEWAYDYSWTYSKDKPISPTLWYDLILTNGEIKQSANELKFTGCPIDNIVYENLFWESTSIKNDK